MKFIIIQAPLNNMNLPPVEIPGVTCPLVHCAVDFPIQTGAGRAPAAPLAAPRLPCSVFCHITVPRPHACAEAPDITASDPRRIDQSDASVITPIYTAVAISTPNEPRATAGKHRPTAEAERKDPWWSRWPSMASAGSAACYSASCWTIPTSVSGDGGWARLLTCAAHLASPHAPLRLCLHESI